MFLTTECVIVEEKEDKPDMPMNPEWEAWVDDVNVNPFLRWRGFFCTRKRNYFGLGFINPSKFH
jgi:hypothetical protein